MGPMPPVLRASASPPVEGVWWVPLVAGGTARTPSRRSVDHSGEASPRGQGCYGMPTSQRKDQGPGATGLEPRL